MRKLTVIGLCLLLPAILGVAFTVNTHRFDPYKSQKFRVRWDGKYVAGISRVSGLRRFTEAVTWREGRDSRQPRTPPTSAPTNP